MDNSTTQMTGKLLVTGGTGKLGRRVVSYLLNEFQINPNQLIVTTRRATSLQDLADKGVDVREADFSLPESLDGAFKGAERLLLISIDAIGQRSELHGNAVKAAEKAGISHLCYTSMPSADISPVVFAFEHASTEKAIEGSSIPNWIILRNNWYYENLAEFYSSILKNNTWMTSAGQSRYAQISRSDLAFAAAASLIVSQAGKTTLTLNGPESLTIEEQAQAIDAVLGTKIDVVHMPEEELKKQLTDFQLPEEVIAMSITMDQHAKANYSDGTSNAFEKLTGKKPQTFSKWLSENRSLLLKLME